MTVQQEQWGVCPWGTEEALKKERHVARFLEREYRDLSRRGLSVADVDVPVDRGPMFEQTEELMEVHYDQELGLFRGFLDNVYLAYTMAFYDEEPGRVMDSSLSLEEAQERKFELITRRAGIEGNERILNLGCGFGALERYLMERYPDVELVSVTPSRTQVKYIQQCMEDPAHVFDKSRLRIIRASFEELDPADLGEFDTVVSVGLIEAVRNLKAFNEKLYGFVRPGGAVFHHLIVSRMVVPQFMDSGDVLIAKYFPGGRVWPFDEIERHAGELVFERKWFVNGMNYWRTLDEWHRRFWNNLDEIRESDPGLDVQHWNDYFILCKACFLPGDGNHFGNGHYLFHRPA